jgi:uncharacterized Zn-binding protein involved in type VI secretion
MPELVVNGALMTCAFGVAPASLTVIRPTLNIAGQPAATIMDFAPNTNIAPFGMCTTLSNPQVASATSAAQGVLTPQPCMPVTTSPWVPGSATFMIEGNPALTSSSTCMCAWGGQISITQAGQVTVTVGS